MSKGGGLSRAPAPTFDCYGLLCRKIATLGAVFLQHCIKGTEGWQPETQVAETIGGSAEVYEKSTFGSTELAQHLAERTKAGDEIELCGLCTDICVVSNALLIKAFCPECEVIVDANACAGVTEESHKAALVTMASCQCRIDNF